MRSYGILAIVLLGLVLFQGCSDDPEAPAAGTVSAVVIDGSVGPVADVEVTLLPFNLVARTDSEGRATFQVRPGDYFVDAHVCCIGPGTIDYHLPVTVGPGENVEVQLPACLVCV
jgi:hypothetical protein